MRHSHGNCTSDTIQRAGKMAGSLAKALDKASQLQVSEVEEHTGYRKKHSYHQDIEAFVSELQEDRLFDNIPGREHVTFPKFQSCPAVHDPDKLKSRLLRYSTKVCRSQIGRPEVCTPAHEYRNNC